VGASKGTEDGDGVIYGFQHEGLLKLPRGCGSNETAAKATASCAVCCVNVVRL